jgi:hypothetical protein
MLIEVDSSQLGDTHLSPEEAVIREREDLIRIQSKHRIYGQDALEDPERSAGPRLYYTEILRRIWTINPEILVRDGSPGQIAIYRPKRRNEYDWEQFDFKQGRGWRWDHEYVTGMAKDWLPQYSHVLIDNANLPTREIRGWRSVLIALIKAGALPYRATIREFGDPSGDQRSPLWFEQLSKFTK